jgi:DNA primase
MASDIEKVLADCGIDYVERQGEYWASCPQHRDRTGRDDANPSWSINSKGLHHCFSCGYSGNLYVLVRDVKGEDVARAYRSEVETFGRSSDIDTRAVKRKATDWVHDRKREARRLPGIPESYLSMFDPEIPETVLADRQLRAEVARAYEVCWNDDSWILPFRHPKGHLLGWQQKGHYKRGFKNQPLDMKKSQTLFGYHVVSASEVVHLVESPLDAIRLTGLGYPAVALAGSKASEAQKKLLSGFDRVVLFLDNDDAGQTSLTALFRALPMSVAVVYNTDEYKDPGEMPDSVIDACLRRRFR